MTYIGQQPATTFDAGIQDRFTGLSTNTVTLTHEIAAEEDILVVWNNIVQDKNTYSVGGTGNKTLTLGGTLVSADVVTVYYLNKVMQSVNPTAGSVTTATINDTAVTGAKLNTDVISAQTALGATPADTDELLVSDAGVLKRVDYSYLKSTNTPAFEVYLSSNQDFSDSTITKVTFNSESYDVGGCFNTTTYAWTPTTAGKYFVYCQLQCFTAGGGYSNLRYAESQIRKNNSQVRAAYNDLQLNEERQQNMLCTAIIDMNGSSDYLDFWCEINTVDNGDGRLISNSSSSRAGGFLLIGA